jgi:hypothetical protein
VSIGPERYLGWVVWGIAENKYISDERRISRKQNIFDMYL